MIPDCEREEIGETYDPIPFHDDFRRQVLGMDLAHEFPASPTRGDDVGRPDSSFHTATIFWMRYSPAVTMAAMALCSAQKPMPELMSRHTPV